MYSTCLRLVTAHITLDVKSPISPPCCIIYYCYSRFGFSNPKNPEKLNCNNFGTSTNVRLINLINFDQSFWFKATHIQEDQSLSQTLWLIGARPIYFRIPSSRPSTMDRKQIANFSLTKVDLKVSKMFLTWVRKELCRNPARSLGTLDGKSWPSLYSSLK